MTLVTSRSDARQEIQALRAIAVLLVIGYHYWPGAVGAGFIGVDVFFVISGFLITSQLTRELRATGRLSFARFYARRARRILPAALTVLVVCLVATFAISSAALWSEQLRHTFASTLFVENWLLAAASVDYLGASAAASPLQHYWSLSVEEQFYIVWPALLLALHWLAARAKPALRMRTMTIALSVIVAASFAYSVVTALTDPAPAFFNTAARVWELGAGALLACGGAATADWRGVRLALGGLGWVLIMASAALLSPSSAFPGYLAAAPVIGTVFVIWAGVPARSVVAQRVLGNVVVRMVAELSFAAYLWHWPLLIFARQLAGDELAQPVRLLLVIATFALALATTVLIERPVRFGPLARRRARLSLVLAATLVSAIAVAAVTSLVVFEKTIAVQAAAAPTAAPGVCVGAEALDPASTCADGPYAALVPNPLLPRASISVLHGMGCAVQLRDAGLKSCDFGDVGSDVRVALVGDSHAMKMWPAIKRLAEENGWHLFTFLRGACMYTAQRSDQKLCDDWRHEVTDRLAQDGPWDLVFTTTVIGVREKSGPAVEGLRAAWRPLLDAGAQVVVISDNPALPESPQSCVVDNMPRVSMCDVARTEVSLSDIQTLAAEGEEGVHVVDLTSFYCSAVTCFVSAGGVLLYQDSTHLNDEYTVTLAPYIAAQLEPFASQILRQSAN